MNDPLYGDRNKIVLKINDDISLSILQGDCCCGKAENGTVEIGVLYKGYLMGEPHGYRSAEDLVQIIYDMPE